METLTDHAPNVPPLPLLTDGAVAMWMATLRPIVRAVDVKPLPSHF